MNLLQTYFITSYKNNFTTIEYIGFLLKICNILFTISIFRNLLYRNSEDHSRFN